MAAPIYKEVFLQNVLNIKENNGNDTYIYLKMPLQTLQTLPHAFDNQVIEEIYINVVNNSNSSDLYLILPPISNPNISSLPQPSLPDYTSADNGFKGSWNIKIYINWNQELEDTKKIYVLPFQYDETYQDTINGFPFFRLDILNPYSTIYLKPVDNNLWMQLNTAQVIL